VDAFLTAKFSQFLNIFCKFLYTQWAKDSHGVVLLTSKFKNQSCHRYSLNIIRSQYCNNILHVINHKNTDSHSHIIYLKRNMHKNMNQ